jgi:HlyD family secretion protein
MKKILSILLLSVLLASCAPADDNSLQASGLIEATEIAVAPELSGRVIEVLVAEGDAVKSGDLLLTLDDSLLQAQKRTLEAAQDSANANVAAAQSALDMAQLQYDQLLDAAIAAEQPTRVSIWDESKPGVFDQPIWYFNKSERLAATQAEVDVARTALETAQEKLDGVVNRASSETFLDTEEKLSQMRVAYQIAKDVYDRTPSGDLREAAKTVLDDARIDLEDVQKDYDDLLTSDDTKDIMEARADVAVAQERYDTTMDALRAFETGADAPEVVLAAQSVKGARTTLEAAKTAVNQVQAQLSALEAQIGKLSVYAPLDGVVLVRSVQPGEVIQAGMTTMTIAKLDSLTVTVYISEDRYGEVSLGQSASLNVDSFPDETFTATVTRIADQAEYTPRNVQTKEERQTTVYAVELTVENPDGKLKPGMPVDVTFEIK